MINRHLSYVLNIFLITDIKKFKVQTIYLNKIIIWENGRHTNYDYLYNRPTKIELLKSFKYLGVHLFKNGKWTQKRTAQHASSQYITYL